MDGAQLYLWLGKIFGAIGGAITLASVWYFIVREYGMLPGLVFGWIPSAAIAVIAYYALKYLWAPVALSAFYLSGWRG